MQDRIGALMAEAWSLIYDPGVPLPFMIGVGSPAHLELFADAYLPPAFLSDAVKWYGFHPASVLNHTGTVYQNGQSFGYVGWPPAPALFQLDLQLVRAILLGFLVNHNADGGVLEETCIRSFTPQFLTDVDNAFQEPANHLPTVGRLTWTGAASPFAQTATFLADGSAWHPGEALSLQGRWNLFGAAHDGSQFSGTGLGAGQALKAHLPPSGTRASSALRPLVLESPVPATTGDPEATLIVFGDPYDEVPTHSHYAAYPPPTRPERFRIWARAFIREAGNEYQSALTYLGQAASLPHFSEDLSYRDIDDNLGPGGPAFAQVLPLKSSRLSAPGVFAASAKERVRRGRSTTCPPPAAGCASARSTWTRSASGRTCRPSWSWPRGSSPSRWRAAATSASPSIGPRRA